MLHLSEEGCPPLGVLKGQDNIGLRANPRSMSLDLNLLFCITLLFGPGQVTPMSEHQ